MAENFILGCSPEFASEIGKGLEALGKEEYTALVRDSGGTRFITFAVGQTEQTLEIKNDEWRTGGVVSEAIIEHLHI
jgi:protein gp37